MDDTEKLIVPKKYKYAVLELGNTATPNDIIETFNDIFDFDDDPLVSYKDKMFILESGDKITKNEVFYYIHEHLVGSDNY